jgi:hypothetical protein
LLAGLQVDPLGTVVPDDVVDELVLRTGGATFLDAATDADWAEQDAAAAIDYAEWAVDNARLTILDAIDARAYAVSLADTTSS